METKDIIGKEIECFKFDNMQMLIYKHDHYLGRKAIVLNVNKAHPEYSELEIITDNDKIVRTHYPTAGIIEQLKNKHKLEEEEEEKLTIDDILNNIKNLTKEL